MVSKLFGFISEGLNDVREGARKLSSSPVTDFCARVLKTTAPERAPSGVVTVISAGGPPSAMTPSKPPSNKTEEIRSRF